MGTYIIGVDIGTQGTKAVLFDENMNPMESAKHAMMTVKIKTDKIFAPGSIVRKKSE